MSDSEFELPESIVLYLSDPAVRTAVNELGFENHGKIPDDFEWEDLGPYYRALLAAVQTKLELAIALEHLWRLAWRPHGPTITHRGWEELQPAEQVRASKVHESDISPDGCLDEWVFTRVYQKKGRPFIYLSVAVDKDGLSVGVSVYSKQNAKHLERANLDRARFEYVRDYDSWWSVSALVPVSITPQLAPISTSSKILINVALDAVA